MSNVHDKITKNIYNLIIKLTINIKYIIKMNTLK